MSSLYDLKNEYRMLLEMTEDPEVDEQAIIDTMDSIEGEIEDKADGYARVIAQKKRDVESIEAEIGRLSERLRREKLTIDTMQTHLKDALIETGKTKFTTSLFSFNVRNNGGKLPVIYRAKPEELPEEFRTEVRTYKVNDEAVRKYLDSGEHSDYFAYGVRGKSLIIR